MSPLERPTPPAGEEIHIPEGSIQPMLLALFITMTLIGLTFHWIVLAFGLIGTVWVIVRWIADARHELAELPASHDH
ncbi:MAG: hypothetical protein ACJ762_16615 [Solirubrobacteraceae bacterium]